MAEEVAPVALRVEHRLRDLSMDVRGECVIRYLFRQFCQGRNIDDVLSDAFLLTHTSEVA